MLERARQVFLVLDECLNFRLESLIQIFLFLEEGVDLLLEVADLPIQLLNLLLRQLVIRLHLRLK